MLIVIRDADFSANNIGTISVPEDLNAFTKAALAASNNNGLASDKKQALNTFFKEMGAFGSQSNLWSKFDMVYLPFVVSGMEYSLMNYIDNTTVVTPSTSYFSKVNGGIKPIANIDSSSAANALKISTNYVFDYRSKSTIFLATEDADPTVNQIKLGVVTQYSTVGSGNFKRWGAMTSGASPNYNTIVPLLYINNSWSTIASDPSALYFNSGSDLAKGVRGISCDGTTVYFMGANGTVKSTPVKSGSESYASTAAGNLFFNCDHARGYIDNYTKFAAQGALIMGTYLTSSEMKTVQTSLMKLYNAFFN